MVNYKLTGLILILSITINSCGYRNEFGRKRFKKMFFPMKINNNHKVFEIIDTTCIYGRYSHNYEDQTNGIDTTSNHVDYLKKELGPFVYYWKFYKNGKLGKFLRYGSDISSINPKEANMGKYYYDFKANKLITATYFRHPQGGGIIRNKFSVEKQGDTLILNENNKIIKKFKIIKLPKEFLIYTPDW